MRVQEAAVVEIAIVSGSSLPVTGWVDVSEEVSTATFDISRASVSRKPTYGRPEAETRMGARSTQVAVEFEYDEDDAESVLFDYARDAILSAGGELWLRVLYDDAAVSADNPWHCGIVGISGLRLGTAVTEFKSQSQTWPVREFQLSTAA